MTESEAMREREAESAPSDLYEEMIRTLNASQQRAQTGKIVVRGKDQPWEQGRQGLTKHLLYPLMTDTAITGWGLFVQEIHTHSGRHRHQGGLVIYVLEGTGYTVVDGRRVDWEEGDLILLPVRPGGVEHQHFNLDPARSSRWLAISPFHLQDLLGNFVKQVEVHPDWQRRETGLTIETGGSQAAVDEPQSVGGTTGRVDYAAVLDSPQSQMSQNIDKPADLLEDLLARRDAWRQEMEAAIPLVKGRDMVWETNRQGWMQWYLHPAIPNAALRAMLVWRQEIPAGSRSGKQRVQGGIVHYVIRGRGYTVVNGTRHDWEAGDAIGLSVTWNGLEYQHFNGDVDEPVLMVAGTTNLFDIFGVDQGTGFEQLEDAPEYAARSARSQD